MTLATGPGVTAGPAGPAETTLLTGQTPRPVREPRGDRVLNVAMMVGTGVFALTILYPLVFIISASVSDPRAVSAGEVVLWPVGFSLDAYQTILDYPTIVRGFVNSALYAGSVMVIACALTMTGGYALSRRDLPGRRFFSVVLIVSMMFSGGMIPTYILMKNLHLLNTPWVMIIPSAMSVWNLIVTRAYFQTTIPHELLESAQLDGCSDFRFFFRIVLPLSKPILAVNALLFAVGSWNAYFNGLIYLTDEQLFPLQLVMRDIMQANTFDPSILSHLDPDEVARLRLLATKLKYALIVVASVPPLLAYPFVQKHFVKGMMVGSLKG